MPDHLSHQTVGQGDDLAGFFGQRDKRCRRDIACSRVFPAGQHFHAPDRTVPTIHHGLIEGHDLPAGNGKAQRFLGEEGFIHVPVQQVSGKPGDDQQKRQDSTAVPEKPVCAEERRLAERDGKGINA